MYNSQKILINFRPKENETIVEVSALRTREGMCDCPRQKFVISRSRDILFSVSIKGAVVVLIVLKDKKYI